MISLEQFNKKRKEESKFVLEESSQLQLGDKVIDKTTGLNGTLIAIASCLGGHTKVEIAPFVDMNNNTKKNVWTNILWVTKIIQDY